MGIKAKDRCGFMLYHLDIGRIGPPEMKRMIAKKYSNGYSIGISLPEIGQTIMQCRLAQENNDAVWISLGIFKSDREKLEDYMGRIDKAVTRLKEENAWDAVVGFHWDEPILNGQTNEGFLQMTKALYEAYGKRIYPVFSTYEITGYKGNEEDKDGKFRFEKFASKYITDIGFDSYGCDVRPDHQDAQQGHLAELRKDFPEITDGEMYYRSYTQKLKDLMIGEPNIWYYPCAYLYNTWCGVKSDEDYCIAHLEFFLKLLKEEKHPGGIHVYNWKTWYDYRPALDVMLDDENPNRWNRYEEVLRRINREVSEMKLNPEKR